MAKIRKRNHKWQIDYYDPRGKRVRKTFPTKKEAEAELGKRVSLIAEGRYLDVKMDCKTTFGELLERYKENFQHQASYKSPKRYHIRRFKKYFGEDTPLSQIRYYDLETFRTKQFTQLTSKGKQRAPSTINSTMSCLHHIFTKAAEWELIERSPFDRGKSLLFKTNNMRTRFLSEVEIPRLIACCPHHLRKVVIFALNTGMRRGEILSLQWAQIHDGFIYLQKTKTNESRQIPINDTLAQLFHNIRQEQHLTSQYVFTYAKGEEWIKGKKPINKRKMPAPLPSRFYEFKKSFKKALKDADIHDFRFHDLRHTFASQMIMRGAGITDIQEILGHKTLTMTLRYAHLTQEHKKKAVNLLNDLTASSLSFGHWMVTGASKSPNSQSRKAAK